MDSFTDDPLLALQEISRRYRPITARDLETLKQQIEAALMTPAEDMRPLSLRERAEGIAKYGPGAVVIGDFVIKRR